MYPNEENTIVVPITKRKKIVMSIQVCLISWVNINFKESGGKKSFSCESKALKSCIPMRQHDYTAHNKKNRDCYEYPRLSHVIDEL